jgi:hypothetical protein
MTEDQKKVIIYVLKVLKVIEKALKRLLAT